MSVANIEPRHGAAVQPQESPEPPHRNESTRTPPRSPSASLLTAKRPTNSRPRGSWYLSPPRKESPRGIAPQQEVGGPAAPGCLRARTRAPSNGVPRAATHCESGAQGLLTS